MSPKNYSLVFLVVGLWGGVLYTLVIACPLAFPGIKFVQKRTRNNLVVVGHNFSEVCMHVWPIANFIAGVDVLLVGCQM
jgi:hypothetical protein